MLKKSPSFFSVFAYLFSDIQQRLWSIIASTLHRKVFFTYILTLTLLHLFWSYLWLFVDCTLIIVFCTYHFLSHEFHRLIHFPLGNFIIQKWLFCFLHYQFLSCCSQCQFKFNYSVFMFKLSFAYSALFSTQPAYEPPFFLMQCVLSLAFFKVSFRVNILLLFIQSTNQMLLNFSFLSCTVFFKLYFSCIMNTITSSFCHSICVLRSLLEYSEELHKY